MICYETPSGLAISLYTDATVRARAPEGLGVELRMSTRYPSDGRVEIEVIPEHSGEFDVALRIPRWCSGARVSVKAVDGTDGEERRTIASGRFYLLRRTWNRGDTVEIDFPMGPRLVAGREAQSGRFAVVRGPSVYTLNRSACERLRDIDLRLLVADPGSIGAPVPDDSVRTGGIRLPIRAWGPDAWYPGKAPELGLALTEFPDPVGELVYLKPPIPNDSRLVADELLGGSLSSRARPGVAEDFYMGTVDAKQANIDDAETLERLQG